MAAWISHLGAFVGPAFPEMAGGILLGESLWGNKMRNLGLWLLR